MNISIADKNWVEIKVGDILIKYNPYSHNTKDWRYKYYYTYYVDEPKTEGDFPRLFSVGKWKIITPEWLTEDEYIYYTEWRITENLKNEYKRNSWVSEKVYLEKKECSYLDHDDYNLMAKNHDTYDKWIEARAKHNLDLWLKNEYYEYKDVDYEKCEIKEYDFINFIRDYDVEVYTEDMTNLLIND